MVEAIEPITSTKKKKVYQPFLVVPPPPQPQVWAGALLPHHFSKIIFDGSTRVMKATGKNFQWQKEKRDQQVKEERVFNHKRRNQQYQDNRNFYKQQVAIIQEG